MRKLTLLAVFAVSAVLAYAGTALAESLFSKSDSTTTTLLCTQLDAGHGADVNGASGYTVVVSADRPDAGNQALIGGGTLKCCSYNAVATAVAGATPTRRWMSCNPSLDIPLDGGAGLRDYAGGSFSTPSGSGRIAYVPSAVTLDGGSTVTTTIIVRKGALR